ncbi:hypothetical protein GGR52DRAFT_573612 [Hypoxylon sp. FL1284]|nr:hypothetical protein GGR52DRAFT_573612 [Hypoxylon sp. FL1284]
MQYTTAALSLVSLLPTLALGDCSCHHNNDPGRWGSETVPADVVADLCKSGGTCEEGPKARLCAVGDVGQCLCAMHAATDWQSKHGGDWFLFSGMNCGDLTITMDGIK